MLFDSAAFLKNVTTAAGVYQMLDVNDVVIYVGKAKNLKKRLASYFRSNITNGKTRVLVSKIVNIKVIVTNTETEALILENDLIKHHMPKYNVLLRDDKSYPFIFISEHRHPRITSHRGAKKAKGKYFGPYPNSGAVRESLHLMQKIFPIRQCEDAYYRNRSRPCLQYQLKRCLAPCVAGKVSDEDYANEVKLAGLFLAGDSQKVLGQLVEKMEAASHALNFEAAARYRDQLTALRKVQEQQWINSDQTDVDVVGFNYEHGIACFHLLFIRNGKVLGSRSYYPKIPKGTESAELYSAFILQFYLNSSAGRQIPRQVLHNCDTLDQQGIGEALSSEAGYKVQLHHNTRGERAKLVDMAQRNARIGLESKLAQKGTQLQRITALEQALDSDKKITRMECFDISHTSGQQTVASCVVFDREGPAKAQYRKFNIEGITPGDDYAAMRQALSRRFAKANDAQLIPDVLFIDGGKGQLTEAEEVIAQYQEHLPKIPLLLGVAKGEGRKPGLETLIVGSTREIIDLENDNAALHLIQHIRDESHRFAITGHRARRAKVKNTSTLESIPGVGPKRRQALIKYLGGMQELKKASREEIAKVPGVSAELAAIIFDSLNH
ncbi:excinuclease ABC subunit UvrC [Psychrobium sp. 1_MG-2023]|uniref:excinuclease ABC subunit UvrC n=1 Tax=Psychrobium sp. 1_MG-2023 TaxID=3062624 RepID=UPI000C324B97|nr:excinuclease ABC subunit UvrC [Psychrobium sp. 1_MG-2023]MDP2562571.1 excinuclease ABC subunit UvrC [Psychrobium sp. 1_MG-2023]PKF59662.1 excinuclease ABC subunit C [Alteromonadales bacterium alter-6D02]